MRNYKLKPFMLVALALLFGALMVQTAAAAGGSGSGTVSLATLDTAVTQNFSTLATTGTANAMSITGWYVYEANTGSAADGNYRAGTGSDNAGDSYSYGAAANTERALGSLWSSSVNPSLGAQFTNNTGSTITSLDVAYTGEMWRAGVAGRLVADRLDFQLSTNATSLTTGTWTDYNSLDFNSPTLNVGTAGALNGNDAANRTALSFSITGVSIANGASFWVRWVDTDVTGGADDGLAVDDFSITPHGGVVDNPPTVTSTTPANSATNVALAADVSVTFSEAVTVSGAWYTISCASSGAHTATVSGGPTTFTLNPDTNFTGGELCTVTIESTLVADQDGTADNMTADYTFSFTTTTPPVSQCGNAATPIHDVQGNGAASPDDGIVRTIEGIVVGDFQDYTADPPNELSGYFLQEEDAQVDADPNTSEGIFVFDGQNPATNVAMGDKVRVTGTVDEFNTLTEITSVSNTEVCSSANTLPTAAPITLPVTILTDYEKYEGMRVTFPQELTVTDTFTLGRYGEILLSEGGRLPSPTHAAEPGAPAQAVRAANILRSIYLDDGLTNQNPDPLIHPAPGLSASNTLRGGDTTTGLTGTLYYLSATGEYRIMPSEAITWNHENPRPTDAPVVGSSLQIVGSNTLNYFITIDPNSNDSNSFTADDVCGPNYDGNTANGMECRGADSSQEFTRQRDKFLNALAEMDADVFGLMELENNAQAAPAGDDNDPVLEDIVNGLNALVGAGTYDFIDTGTLGNDAIKVGLIYKPATVTPVGDFAVLDSSVDPLFDTSRNRPALAQTFEEIATGGQLTVVVNHFKSKGSDCGGAPDDQPDTSGGNCNGTRTDAATALVNWLNTDPTDSGDPDFLVVGDLNSYAKEDPIDVFINAGYVDLADAYNTEPYSYTFDGEWGYLDYALANPTLATQVTDAEEWHVNADEPIALDYNTEFKSAGQISSFYSTDPFRWSDHDPIIVGFDLDVPDTTAPDTTITDFPPNPSASNSGTFKYTSTEGGNQFECKLDADPWTDCDDGQLTFSGLTEGSHTFEVRAIDAAGNTDPTPDSWTWVIDTTAPNTTITSNPDDPSNSANASFEFTGDDGSGVGGVTFECRIDSGSWTPCTSPQAYTGLSDGSHTFEVRAKDSLGNTDSSPASYTWVIDTAGPTVTINQAGTQADPTSASPIHFTVVFSEPVSGFTDTDVTLSGTAGATTAVVTQIAPNDGTTYDVAVSGMTSNGTVIATVPANVAQDTAGNGNALATSTDNTVTYTGIDDVPPTVTINQAGTQADPTSASPIHFTVVFSEPVSGFTDTDVTLSGTAGATTAVVTQIAPNDGTTYDVAVSGMTNDGTVIATIGGDVAQDTAGNGNAASTSTDNTVTYVAPPTPEAQIYVSTATAGHVGSLSYGAEDILMWDGSAWSIWFDGSAAGLVSNGKSKHDINAFYIPETLGLVNNHEVLMSFTQNARKVPGISGKVDGMDLVTWDGSAFSLTFDGQDVGLTVLTNEKIDGLHALDPSLAPAAVRTAAGGSCVAYYLISTQGAGQVTNYSGGTLKFGGEDILGFCASQLGSTTAGKWHMVLDASTKGVKPNAITSISASADGNILYFTTKAAFHVGGATGGHSMIYTYNMTTGQFSGPVFSAPAAGLTEKVDALHTTGDLP